MYIMSSEKGFFSNLTDKISSATRSITSSTKGAVQSIKQSISDLNEDKYRNPQTKIESKFNPNSPDDQNYEMKSQSAPELSISKCLVHITCEDAAKLKKILQNHICEANKRHFESKKELEKTVSMLKSYPPSAQKHVQSIIKELNHSKEKLEEARNEDRKREFDIPEDTDIEVFITLSGYRDLVKAKVSKIDPDIGSFNIIYQDGDKNKEFTGIKFEQLCIGESADNINRPATNCTLEDNACQLEGGGKNKSKSLSKKVKKMNGGSMESSISTDSLC